MTPYELRQHIAQALATTLAPHEFRESGYAFGLMADQESSHHEHLTYSIGLTSSEALPGSQRHHVAWMTTVGIDLVCRVRGDAQVEDYDRALRAEMQMVSAIAAVKDICHLPITVTDVQRNFIGDGTVLLIELTCQVPHPAPLNGEVAPWHAKSSRTASGAP